MIRLFYLGRSPFPPPCARSRARPPNKLRFQSAFALLCSLSHSTAALRERAAVCACARGEKQAPDIAAPSFPLYKPGMQVCRSTLQQPGNSCAGGLATLLDFENRRCAVFRTAATSRWACSVREARASVPRGEMSMPALSPFTSPRRKFCRATLQQPGNCDPI